MVDFTSKLCIDCRHFSGGFYCYAPGRPRVLDAELIYLVRGTKPQITLHAIEARRSPAYCGRGAAWFEPLKGWRERLERRLGWS